MPWIPVLVPSDFSIVGIRVLFIVESEKIHESNQGDENEKDVQA